MTVSSSTEAATTSALRFDASASSYVEVPDDPSLRIPDDLTVEAWVKPSAGSGDGHVVGKSYYELSVDDRDGALRAVFALQIGGARREVVSGPLTRDRWSHLAATYDGATLRLFVDGAPAGTAAAGGPIDQGFGPLRIGRDPDAYDYFPGTIDEVRVSSVVRYAAAFTVPAGPFTADASTRGLWHFDEGQGTTARDASANGNDGALLGGASWTSDSPFPAPPPTGTPSNTPTATASGTGPTATPAVGSGCPCAVWDDASPTTASVSDQKAVELGVKFRSAADGYVAGVRFYKGPDNAGPHVGNLWTSTGQLLASVAFTGETPSGWQEVSFASPVAIRADTTYVVSYFAPSGGYAFDAFYFAGRSVTNGPLTALADGADGGNGVFRYTTTSAFPGQTYRASNYWVDLVFLPATASPPPATATAAASATPTGTAAPGSTATPTRTPTAPAPTATATATAASGPPGAGATTPGALVLKATYQSIGVYANFSGDPDADNRASLEYRRVGETAWKRGMDMTPDRRQTVFGADGTYDNPFKNQWRASVLMTQPGTDYEVRVTFADPDGVGGTNPVVARVRTREESSPTGGATYHVAGNGGDANPGTAASPWRTLGKAAGTVVAGDTVVVHAGTYSPVSISRSGTAANWIVFRAAPNEQRPVISAGAGSGTLAYITGSYVRFGQHDSGTPAYTGGFELVGGQSGVVVGGAAHDVVVEGNIIRGTKATNQEGVSVQVGETFSTQSAVANVTVQDNDIRQDTLPEPETDAVLVKSASGGHVFRRNKVEFFYPGGNVHGTDCFGGLPNFAPWGGYYADTDVSDNTCIGATDEGIEIDGGNANVRIWGNSISRANLGFSITPVYYGPVYVFRNVVYNLQDHWVGSCVGVKDGEGGSGAVYFYHNTFSSPSGTGCNNTVKGFAKYGGGNAQSNVVIKNNILRFWGRLYETGSKTADYDLNYVELLSGDKVAEWNGTNYWSFASFQAGSGQEAHGLWGTALFVNLAGLDFRLALGSPGVDRGAPLPGFNDPDSPWPYRGAAPDIGAFES